MHVLSFGEVGKGPLTVFLHGFPGLRSRQNRDLAENVARETGRPVRAILYSGLGHAPGTFAFEQCLEDVRTWFRELFASRPNEKIHLVGHSWGGFLSLRMASEFPQYIERIVLMSPLLHFAPEELAFASFSDTAQHNPQLSLIDVRELAKQFVRVGANNPTREMVAAIPPSIDIIFLQAKDDNITPPDVAEDMLKSFCRKPEYHLVDNDHSFLSNRDDFSIELSQYLTR